MPSAIQALKLESDPILYDKKCHSEHQTLFIHVKFGHESTPKCVVLFLVSAFQLCPHLRHPFTIAYSQTGSVSSLIDCVYFLPTTEGYVSPCSLLGYSVCQTVSQPNDRQAV